MSGWKDRAITLEAGEKVELKNLEGYWLIPKKLSTSTYQKVSQLQKKSNLNKDDIVIDDNFRELIKVVILHGIHDHNFDDEDGKKIVFNDENVSELLEHFTVASEMFQIVMGFNAPLPQGSGEKSETAQSGPSEGLNSEKEKSSLTEQTPQN
jgi:hypothetical protein